MTMAMSASEPTMDRRSSDIRISHALRSRSKDRLAQRCECMAPACRARVKVYKFWSIAFRLAVWGKASVSSAPTKRARRVLLCDRCRIEKQSLIWGGVALGRVRLLGRFQLEHHFPEKR